MNNRRLWVIKWCALISATMILFPPVMRNGTDYGYGFLFDMEYTEGILHVALQVNIVMLVLQIAMLWFIGGAFYTGKRPPKVGK